MIFFETIIFFETDTNKIMFKIVFTNIWPVADIQLVADTDILSNVYFALLSSLALCNLISIAAQT